MLPEKYKEKIKEMLGEDEAREYFDTFNKKYFAGMRVNTLKTSVDEFKKISPFDIKKIDWTPKGFYYSLEDKPAKHPYYYAGLYYIQEPSAMAPATYLPIDKHDKVLDLCAAPGGKSTELAAKLDGSGLLVTNDISASRAKALLKNIEISGVTNAIVTSMAPHELKNYFEGYFDKILVDAPCSGEGMFRKDPSIIKNWEQYGVEYYSKLQKEIILFAADMLKPGGQMIYSTCTFSKEEDEGTIEYLLTNRSEFSIETIDYDFGACGQEKYLQNPTSNIKGIERTKRLWPHKINGEGHFLALLKKDENANTNEPKINKIYKSKKIASDEFFEFLKNIKKEFDEKRFISVKDKVYYIPEDMLDIKGLKVLRNGLLMGEIKTKRFEPSQALASSLKMEEYKNVVNFSVDDERVIRYLKGETIVIDDSFNVKNGWCLVCVDGYSLGFAKNANNTLKNKYLAGWRWM